MISLRFSPRASYLLLACAFLMLGFSTAAAQGDSWTFRAPMGEARTFAQSCVLDGKLYVLGGCPISGAAVTTVERHDPVANTWTALPPMPAPRCYAWVCVCDGKIYVIGGGPGMWDSAEQTVFRFDPATSGWEQLADMPGPGGAGAVGVVDGIIYMIGGGESFGTPVWASVIAFDADSGVWSFGTDMPTARTMCVGCVVEGKIYVFGGTSENWQSVEYQRVEAYDPATDTWERRADMPTARWSPVVSVVGSRIHVVGGRAAGYSSTVHEVYDPATDSWSTAAPLQVSRTAAVGGTLGDRFYVAGGHEGPPMVFFSSVEEYTVPTTGIDEGGARGLLPPTHALAQNFPNPFNAQTIIRYDIRGDEPVRIGVYDMLGREVMVLLEGHHQAGSHAISVDAARLASGVYYYTLRAGSFHQTRSMVLLK